MDPAELEVERIESNLNSLIERRAEQCKDKEEESERWVSSVKSFHQSNTREIFEAHIEFHTRQAQSHRSTLGALVDYHEGEVRKYKRMLVTNSFPGPDLALRPGRAEMI